jgi:DNA-binding transcriptional LysR family regulator
MEIHQLKTFVAVAREGSITRASERLHLSQPAVSAHIKAIEDTLGLTLFERTARGMSLTSDGQRLFAKAEQTLRAHRDLLEEATRIKGRLTGKLRLGVASNSSTQALGRLLTVLSVRCPEVEVAVKHGTSQDLLNGMRNGSLDAGFYNEAGEPDAELTIFEVARFGIYLVAPPGLVALSRPLDWQALAELPWICPTSSSCCGQAAENLFKVHQIRPQRIIDIDRENVTRTLIAGGVGVGLLHEETAKGAQASGEVELVCEAQNSVRVLFAHLACRAGDPLLSAVSSIVAENGVTR